MSLFPVAVQLSMPDFHAKMKNKLRTESMGADTVVWLAVSAVASNQPSGLFFQGETQGWRVLRVEQEEGVFLLRNASLIDAS